MSARTRNGSLSKLATALATSWLFSGALAATTVDLATARASLATAEAQEIAGEMQRLREHGSVPALVALLRERVLGGSLDAVAREALLERGIQFLAELPAHTTSRALASELAHRSAEIFVLTDPEHGARGVPLYDTGAVARFAQRNWQRREARDQALGHIRRGEHGAISQFAGRPGTRDSDPVKAGILDAFTVAGTAGLHSFRAPLIEAVQAGGHADELLLLFARRLRDPELFTLLIERADPAVSVHALAEVPEILDGTAALGVLSAATQRAELASAGLLALSPLARTSSAARRKLFEALEDPALGPSAAAALGNLHDAGVAADLGRTLEQATDESVRRHAAMALKFDGGTAARDVLARFAASGKASSELRKEVSAWLARQ